MKYIKIKYVLFLALTVVSVLSASARKPVDRKLNVTDISVSRLGDVVRLSLKCEPGLQSVEKKQTVVVTPVLYGNGRRAEFARFAVKGKRVRKADCCGFGEKGVMESATYGEVIEYVCAIAYEDWMDGARLVFESESYICSSKAVLADARVPGEVAFDRVQVSSELPAVHTPDYLVVEVPIGNTEKPMPSTAERLAQSLPYLQDVSLKPDFDPNDRANTLIIRFHVGSTVIERDFRGNGANMDELVDAIKEINRSSDSRVTGVILAGFASPEGSASRNMFLAERRANAVRDHLVKSAGVSYGSVEVFNGGIDWTGLRQLVELSEMKYAAEALRIIDNPYLNDQQRLSQLKSLRAGEPYRHMLLNFFPELRTGMCIKVYYENTDK